MTERQAEVTSEINCHALRVNAMKNAPEGAFLKTQLQTEHSICQR